MDSNDKASLKGELQTLNGILSSGEVFAALAKQGANPTPITGPVVILPAFSSVSDGMRFQHDMMKKILALVEKVIEKA